MAVFLHGAEIIVNIRRSARWSFKGDLSEEVLVVDLEFAFSFGDRQIAVWLAVADEDSFCERLGADAVAGNVPAVFESRARFSVSRIQKIEIQTKHDIIAFLTNVAEHVGPDSRYIHMGLTSNDAIDTGQAL